MSRWRKQAFEIVRFKKLFEEGLSLLQQTSESPS